MPTVRRHRISLGQGIIYYGYPGQTPTISAGYIENINVDLSRDVRVIKSGTPRTIRNAIIVRENAELVFTGLQWQLPVMAAFLGMTTIGGNIHFGESTFNRKCSLALVHASPFLSLSLYIWNAVPEPAVTVDMLEIIHRFPFRFRAIKSSTDWASNTLVDGKNLFKLSIMEM